QNAESKKQTSRKDFSALTIRNRLHVAADCTPDQKRFGSRLFGLIRTTAPIAVIASEAKQSSKPFPFTHSLQAPV
ncbi:MAG: hypothetical protein LBI35_03885, partial [Burkholderiales bacterium]|nr:hypothetical protein [Burkholderiales bacterium]